MVCQALNTYMWKKDGKIFTIDDAGDAVGFVYIITNRENGMKYVGKKLFWSKRKLPPLKGQKRKRTVIKESDWQGYYGSNEILMVESKESPEKFDREILHLCSSKSEMSYMELLEQIERKVLFDDSYYNRIINVKIHANHVKSLAVEQC